MISMASDILYQSIKDTDPFIYKLKNLIDWDTLSNTIDKSLPKKTYYAGRTPFPTSLMLKILILQEIYNLSDDAAELHINKDISYKFFLGMDILDKSPDAKTIWHFKEKLRKHKLELTLFDEFHKYLKEQHITLSKGTIVDASFVSVPKQRNTREENKQIKEGETPNSFKENEAKQRQKDTDARWTKKNGKSYYGYKVHISTPTNEQFISRYKVTPANVHESQVVEEILAEETKQLYGDSAYRSEEISQTLKEKGIRNYIHHRKYREKPLTEKELSSNRRKSKTRAKVEHVFAWFRNSMNRGLELRCIGMGRAEFRIGVRNTCYNILKYISLQCV